MSVLQCSNGEKDVQVWNNAAFDGRDSIEKNSLFIINPLDSFESFSTKENHSPSSLTFNSSVSSLKPINPNGDEKDIDKEIQEIQMEIKRLASRLEDLRIKKAQKIVKNPQKIVKIIPGKFMDQKHNPEENKKMEESLSMNSKSSKLNRRGLSLGPAEIASGSRRGLSLGPSEIVSAKKSKQDFSTTPLQPMKNRRKSCFWKLEDIDEGELTTRGKMRQVVTTIGSNKYVKKDDQVLTSVQPKKLFGNAEKTLLSSATKKPVRQGRVVASRYNQISSSQPSSVIRKMSLPYNGNDESKRCEKKRSLSAQKNRGGTVEENKNVDTQRRLKKRWEIPTEIVIHGKSPESVSVMHDLLPKLRVGRLPKESPRDSGPAKKVAQLIGRKSFFYTDDEEMEQPVRQSLSFAEEDDAMSMEEEEDVLQL